MELREKIVDFERFYRVARLNEPARRALVADGAVGALRIVLVSERLAFYLGVGQ